MTGDDAQSVGQGRTEGASGQFTRNQNVYSAPGCWVANWPCVRSTSYPVPGAAITDQQVANFQAAGFEIGLHLWSSGLPGGATDEQPDSTTPRFGAAA